MVLKRSWPPDGSRRERRKGRRVPGARDAQSGHLGLATIQGIAIRLHYSWFLIAALITFSLAARFRGLNPAWSGALVWGAAVLTALLFFASIVVHELSHALVARARGVPVRAITLFALGGVAQIEKESTDPRTEFWMAIVGPVTSVLIGSACLGLAHVGGGDGAEASPATAVLLWLGYINLVLAAFNMIPGFPLDGGRVLRAIVWWATGDRGKALRVAVAAGRIVAVGLMSWGMLQFLLGAGFGGLWLVLIGWFLADAAQAARTQWATTELLRELRVGDLMSRDCDVVPGGIDLRSFVDQYLVRGGGRCYVVEEHGRITGLVTATEVKKLDRTRWAQVAVRDVMRPLQQLRTVRAETPVSEALALMVREDLNQLPVTHDGQVDGVIARAHVLQSLQTRAELGM
jgi:Zn-dependent protease